MKQYVNYKLNTNYEQFIFRSTVLLDRDTQAPVSFTINLGSKENFCVQIRVPSKESQETDAYLMWVEANENCSLESYIKNGIAKHMTLLGLTLARKINPNIKTVSFEDTSSFDCELPNDKEEKVPMKAFHIAFHGATWYEYHFGAMLKRDYNKYCTLKNNIYKPENKPKTFYFINEELQEELEPLYSNTQTWYDFFQEISKKYGKKKCGMVYPWIMSAMNEIFECNIYDDTKWYIDFNANKETNYTPMIDYKRYSITTGGTRRKTIKQRKARQFSFRRRYIFPHIPQIQKWDYKTFIRD